MASLSKDTLLDIYERYQKSFSKKETKKVNTEKENTRLLLSIQNTIDPPQDSLEKVRGLNNLTSVSSFLRGFEVGQAVGLIFDPNKEQDNWGIGTGFLVAPNLLLTNHHVIENKEQASRFRLKMNFQRDLEGNLDPAFDFLLQPENVFITDKYLDFTVVSIQPKASEQTSLSDFGYLKLIEQSGKAIKGNPAIIIQHPDGRPKQTAFFENEVDNDSHPEFITYTTDTMGGSSGSPVFNYEWVVFALHHSGVPTKEYIDTAPETSDETAIEVVQSSQKNVNEGVRISAIMRKIKELDENCYIQIKNAADTTLEKTLPHKPFRFSRVAWGESVFEKTNTIEPKKDEQIISQNHETPINKTMETNDNIIRINIPLEIRLGNSFSAQVTENEDLEKKKKKKKINDEVENPSNRGGFESGFLGSKLKIDLAKIVKPFADKNLIAPLKDGGNELSYTHFSILMHKARKMCIVAAVNIDGKAEKKITRGDDKWLIDERMDAKYQLDNRMYANNDLDRGHMVRREDPNWGTEAEKANFDTFFYTNATPQHKNLNQKEWLQLEDYVLKNTNNNDLKVSAITGPILDENFVPYREGLVPAQFYKIAAFVKKDNTPSVTGYVLSQKEMIDGLERTTEEFVFGKFKTYQVSLAKLEQMTGLDLSALKPFDPLNGQEGNESMIREISFASDLKL